MIFKFRYQTLGDHTHFDVYVGKTYDLTAKSGTLVLKAGKETTAFINMLRRGSGDGGRAIVEERTLTT